MRDSTMHDWSLTPDVPVEIKELVEDLTYDEKAFFESFYRSHVRGKPEDRMTIGQITDFESRFHYNCVENAIISAISQRNPPPPSMMVETWRMVQKRRRFRLLDIGSGTGHWIDFFRDVFFVGESIGVEITESMAAHLLEKYAHCDDVTVVRASIADEGFDTQALGGPFDYVSAVGVMFHIVDDGRWRTALAHLAELVDKDGSIFITGEFGTETRNVQFHKDDQFQQWNAREQAETSDGTIRVNKRLRSLDDWQLAIEAEGLKIADLVRTPRDPLMTTPENDLLVLTR